MNLNFTNSFLKELLSENNNSFPFKIKELNHNFLQLKREKNYLTTKARLFLPSQTLECLGLEPYNNQFTTIILIRDPKF